MHCVLIFDARETKPAVLSFGDMGSVKIVLSQLVLTD